MMRDEYQPPAVDFDAIRRDAERTSTTAPGYSHLIVGNRSTFARLSGDGYVLELVDEAVKVEARYLRRERSQLHAEIQVHCSWAGVRSRYGALACNDLNLSSLTARKGFAAHCQERAKTRPGDFDWIGAVAEVCERVIDAERSGTVGIVLDDAPDEGPPRNFLVHGLSIPADSHSQLVTDGGGLKSLLLLLVLGEMAQQGIPVVYVDWEWNAARHKARKVRLFGAARLPDLHYWRGRSALTHERDALRRFCEDRDAQFLAIDSIGACCDGKLADDDVARDYNRALDGLAPSLAAAHVPKGSQGSEAPADLKAFGSAFFHNYARMTWTVRKQMGATDDVVHVLLTPHKQNDGQRVKPTGLEFTFSEQRIGVRNVNVADVEGMADSLPLVERMRHLLTKGPLTYAEIASSLEAKVNTIVQAAGRGNGFQKQLSQDGITRLALVERNG